MNGIGLDIDGKVAEQAECKRLVDYLGHDMRRQPCDCFAQPTLPMVPRVLLS